MHSQHYLLLYVQSPMVNANTSFCAHLQHLRQCISARVMFHAASKHVLGYSLAVHMLSALPSLDMA